MTQIPDAAVQALVSALRPFSDMAGELFAKNYNNKDVVFSVTRTTEKGTTLTYGMNFEAFANAREAINLFATLTNEGTKPIVVADADGSMTAEEISLENLKQMALYAGPIVSLEFREPYYLASCDTCGWVGSSELCGTDSFGDDSDVYCPRCHSSGADCGKVAECITAKPVDVAEVREQCAKLCDQSAALSAEQAENTMDPAVKCALMGEATSARVLAKQIRALSAEPAQGEP